MGKTVTAVVGIVGAVAIAVAAPFLAPVALGVLGIAATATAVAVATALISTTLAIGLSLAFRALGVGAPSAKNSVGPPQVFRQSITNSFIVYGRRRVGGLLAFFHASQSGDDHFRYFVIACAGHRCLGAVNFMLGDETVTVDGSGKVTSGKYADAAWLWFQRGLAAETANATFVAECGGQWTTAHKGNGIAAIYAKFKLTDDVVQAGMPNITAVIDGRDEILDPRDGLTKFTSNAALVFYDWMKIPREEGGFGAYDDEIPDDAWVSAQANVCDETVNAKPRYALDAVITTGAAPSEIRDVMVVNQAGSYAYVEGKHVMRPGYWVPPSETLSEDDLAGPIQVSPFMPSDTVANEVQGTFIDPAAGYQGAPFTTQSTAASDVRQIDLDLAFTTNLDQADRVAAIMLKRAQAEKTVTWPANIAGLKVAAMDTVQLDTARYSLSNYAWSVSRWGLSADFGTMLGLREENADIYADAAPATRTPPPTVTDGDPVVTSDQIQTVLRATAPFGLTVSASDTGSAAKIHLNAFTLDYPGSWADVAVPAGDINGLDYSTTYYLYADVDQLGDATPSYGATTNYGTALNSALHPKRIYLNQSVTTPAAGGAATGGGPTGGGYGGGNTLPSY